MKILITGFNRFGDYIYNPTESLLEEIDAIKDTFSQHSIYTKVLKTEYRESEREIIELLDRIKPDKVILTGVSETDAKIKIEQIAKNNCNSTIPDNIGFIPRKSKIELNGSQIYESTFQFEEIRQRFVEHSIPFSLSNDAGNYLCNFIYYKVLHHIKRNDLPIDCVFLHIPFFSDYGKNNLYSNTLPKDIVLKAIVIIMNELFT